jgi:HAE1 family hydrophobic/amphiphilic exporter-1
MALAITMATLTTVAVFVPVSLVEGGGQFFLQRLAIPISVSLLASLLVALVVVPLAVYVTLPTRKAGAGRRPSGLLGGVLGGAWGAVRAFHERFTAVLRHAYEATFGNLNRAYGRLLDVCLGRRLDVILVLAVLLGSMVAIFQTKAVRVVPIQEDEQPAFELDVDLPKTLSFEDGKAYFLEAEKVLERLRPELGLDGYLVIARKGGNGEIQGWFTSPRTSDVTPRQAAERVRDALPERAGVKFYFGDEDQGEDEATATSQTFTLTGDDSAELEEVAQRLEGVFRKVPGVLGVKRFGETSPNELALVIDRTRAQHQGVSPRVVAGLVGYALRGQALPRYTREGREVPVRVRFREEDRKSLAELESFAVPTATGSFTPLSAVTDVRYLEAPETIRRRDKRISRTITLELEEGREEATRERLRAMAADVDLPEGIAFDGGRGRQGMDEDLKGLLFAAALSIVFIYLLMGFLFESFLLPLSILFTIPLASIGVAWIHLATRKNLDILGMVGAVLLIGVVVNNGIVLVDYVNRLRHEGHERREAILLASERRFRPIMMTALTTICGMIPLTLGGATSIGLSYTSFGLTLIGGMTTATLLTLLVVPVFYTLIDDAREATLAAARRVAARSPSPAAAVPDAE